MNQPPYNGPTCRERDAADAIQTQQSIVASASREQRAADRRERIAIAAMQGLIAQTPVAISAAEVARQACLCADALIAELDKEK